MNTAKTITLFTLFVTTLLICPQRSDAFSFSFSIAPHTAIKKATDATTKAQAGITLDTTFSVDFLDIYYFEFRGRYLSYRASSPGEDWVLYRAFNALGGSVGGGFVLPEFQIFGEFPAVPSVTLRAYGNFASYTYTDIYYFYPSLEIEPGFTFGRYYDDRLQLELGLPIEWNFQRDLDLFISGGLSLSASLHF